jgi:hypothetical protein
MPWAPATTFSARIGGVVYRNVPQPIVLNGRSLVNLFRDTENGKLAASLELRQQDGKPIATVAHNEVTLHNTSAFLVVQGPRRTAVVEKGVGRVWCDIKNAPTKSDYELDVSALFFSDTGYPVLLHPDRTRIGAANDDQPPNIAFLT